MRAMVIKMEPVIRLREMCIGVAVADDRRITRLLHPLDRVDHRAPHWIPWGPSGPAGRGELES